MTYTAIATTTAGRNGHVDSSDGVLHHDLAMPGSGRAGATNPEQLFAAGYSSCFGSAIMAVAGADKIKPEAVHVTAEVTLNVNGNEPSPAWGMAVSIRGGCVNYGPWADRKRAELQAGTALPSPTDSPRPALDDARRRSFGAATESTVPVTTERPDETGFHGLGTGLGENKGKKAAVSTLLEGLVSPVAEIMLPEVTDRGRYYDIVRKAVAFAFVGRIGAGALVMLWAWRRWKRGGR